MTQKRIPILELNEYIDSKVNMNVLL